jgi:DNA-binding CsgD family transcriptional regulator
MSATAGDWLVRNSAAVRPSAWVRGADELTYFRLQRLLDGIGLRGELVAECPDDGEHPGPALALLVALGPVDWKAFERLRRRAETVVLTSEPSTSGERRALELGAAGYLSLHLGDGALGKSLEGIMSGQAGFSRAVMGQWLRGQSARIRPLDAPSLTPRQRAILERIAQGDADKQIAQRLGIAPATVQKHVHVLLRRLHVRNRAAAVRYAMARTADDRS